MDADRPNEGRLDSWKEIAAYLKRDVRTVQRWERLSGLPVHRMRHGVRGSVHAYPSEIDAWWAARDDHTGPVHAAGRRPWLLAGSVVVAVTIGAIALRFGNQGETSTSSVAAAGGIVWDAPRLLDEATREDGHPIRVAVPAGAHELAISPDGTALWVTSDAGDGKDKYLSVVDLARRAVTWSTSVEYIGPLAVSPNGARVYLGQRDGTILMIDTRTKTVSHMRAPAAHLRTFALTRDGGTLYVAAEWAGLYAITTASGAIRQLSNVPCPMYLALAAAGDRLYVNYQCGGPGGTAGHDAIDVIDARSGASLGPITGLVNVGGDIAVAPDDSAIWANGHDVCIDDRYVHAGCPAVPGGIVNIVRVSDRTLLKSLAVAAWSEILSLAPDGSRALVGGATARTFVVRTGSFTTVESSDIPLLGHPAFSPDGQNAFIALGDPGSIAIVPLRRAPQPPSVLTGRWFADGTVNDAAGGMNGELFGGVTYAPGRVGQAWRLDGGFIRVPDSHALGDAPSFTIAMWVKFTSPPDGAGMTLAANMSKDGPQSGWRVFRGVDGRLIGCLGGGALDGCSAPGSTTRVVGGTALTDALWHHVAFVRDGDTAALYIDGRLDASSRLANAVDEFDGEIRFGIDEHGRSPFTGLLDEVETYNRALKANEVSARVAAAR